MLYKSSIYPFIGLAALIHVALGLIFFKSESQPFISSQDDMGISVTLIKNTISVQGKKLASEKKSKPIIKNNIKTENHFTKNNSENKKPAVNKKIENIDSSTKIIGHIRDKIKYHFYYPRIAQKRNWQGTVTLNLNINKTGEIKDVSILKSSGHDVLDNAALEVLNKIKNKQFLAHIVTKEESIQLPITYQLTEG